ncbi:putative Ig domain-containing protein, partial [Spirosoma soli]
QSATVGQSFSYVIPANTFTDAQTPNSLSLTVSGLPQGLSFVAPATLSGVPSVSGVSSVTVTATDAGSLSVSTSFGLSVSPASSVTTTAPFAITGVSTISCTSVGNQINLSFTPRYAGLSGQPISFSVVNELAPTTAAGPYTLRLYTDNPVITLKATQTGTPGEVSFAYNWLAVCQSGGPGNTAPTVANAVPPQSATVGQSFSYVIPANTFTDAQTPNSLSLTVSGLPQGLSFVAPATLSGVPSVSGVSSVTVTATDAGSLSVSTSFGLSVSPMPVASSGFSILGVTTVSCEVIGADQRRLTFTPQYGGVTGAPISFSVVNEKLPTTDPGPYTLNLYTDNPAINLSAQQGSTVATYRYNWLVGCQGGARLGSVEPGSELVVRVLGNPIQNHQVKLEVRGAEGKPLRLQLTDQTGRTVNEGLVEQAGAIERQTLNLGNEPAGMLLLRVSTPTQSQTVKVLNTR